MPHLASPHLPSVAMLLVERKKYFYPEQSLKAALQNQKKKKIFYKLIFPKYKKLHHTAISQSSSGNTRAGDEILG